MKAWYFTMKRYCQQSHLKRQGIFMDARSGLGFSHTLRAEELSGDVEGLASHHDDLLAIE